MKITLQRDALVKTMARLARIVERRTTVPLLSNVAIFAGEGEMRLQATDLDIEATTRLAVEAQESGSATVPAHLLSDILKKLPAGAEVALASAEASRLTVSCGRSRFALQALPADDFPSLEAGEFTHSFDLPLADLRRLIERTEFAISSEETRYYLNGIYLHTAAHDGTEYLRAVATDGHRLALLDAALPEGAAGMPGVIVPKKTVAELGRLAEDGDSVRVELSASKIRFTFADIVLTSKLVDGSFPDYMRVIPTGNDRVLTVDRDAFTAALERVTAVNSDRSRAVKLAISDGTVTLTAMCPDTGSASEEVDGDYAGEAFEIGFNGRYLIDIASRIGADTVTVQLTDHGSPTILCNPADSNVLYVLMPMRI